jgi:hypothetical protein
MQKRILSIQGGGIRGIIPACALVALEHQTGQLTRDVFEFAGGTSTGGLLVSAIAAGVPAQASLDVYLQSGRAIFSPTDDVRRTLNLVRLGRQFDARTLYAVLKAALGPAATWTINDCPLDVLITAASQLGDTLYFTKDRPTNAGQFGKYNLLDAAVASACATTYHDPWKIPGYGYAADGGCASVSDPIYATCVEAFAAPGCYGSINPADARVISLGTGFYHPSKQPKPPGSLLDRVKWVTGTLVGSSMTIAAQTVQRHWPGVLQVLNPPIPSNIDEADVDFIPVLLDIGQKAASQIDWYKILQLDPVEINAAA